ncbi:MAG: phosphohydrolase [Firmicutes bacterium HGW-Firmicutes-7]|nr:MAG: phosphohydrolase [Firmicutes bacterium HGW-Firmicutes-7]
MKNNRIAAMIICAGYSSRMDDFKPFLKFKEKTAIKRVIDTYMNSGIDDIYVVVGYKGIEVIEALSDEKVIVVMNEAYDKGMFSSITKGIEALDEDITAFFMHPVDIPLVKENTIRLLINEYINSNKGIIIPTFLLDKGHPPLIDCRYKKIILNSSGYGGLKRILNVYLEDSLLVPVFDEATLMDMDTKADYEKLLKYQAIGTLSRLECHAILTYYQVPDHIIKHCKTVERLARDIYEHVHKAGFEFNKEELLAAALLHDLVRQQKNHAIVGARILSEMGYRNIGAMIGTHMDIEVLDDDHLSASEILYLADKLVNEDQIEPLNHRLNQCLMKKGNNNEAIERINQRFSSAKTILKKIERLTGEPLIYG